MSSDVLLAMLGHDLRNPGTTLVSCLELLDEIVHDPDGREALEDAGIALGQLRTAWARIDALADQRETRWSQSIDLVPKLEILARDLGATLSSPPTFEGPAGVIAIAEALTEATNHGRIVLEDRQLRVGDDGPCLPADRDPFSIAMQPEMKRLGRYARFAGLVAAKHIADRLELELSAGKDSLFVLTLVPA